MYRWKLVSALTVAVLIPTQPVATVDASTQMVSPMKADFNGDGYEDLAIGACCTGSGGSGVVSVVYGSQNGLTPVGSQYFEPGVGGVPDGGGFFGYSIAAGDFNGDSYSDLAIGAPAGDNVVVLEGSPSGLTAAGSTLWYQGAKCPLGGEIAGQDDPSGEVFGWSLATGDFDGDTYDDLAVGVPDETEDANKVKYAGAVNIIYGSPFGLICQDNQIWHQGNGVKDAPEENDNFGETLAAGDFNGDGREDLAIGVIGEDLVGVNDAGAVSILFGSIYGLDPAGNQINQLWWQFGTGDDSAEAGDGYGHALAAGYFDADSFEDLAIGVPWEGLGLAPFLIPSAGAVNVLYGSSSGFTVVGAQFLSQATPGIFGNPQNGDEFGKSLASGDFQGDGSDDLAVGVPGDDDNRKVVNSAGSVNVLYGSGNQLWNQGSPGMLDYPEFLDEFGECVGVGDFDGDGAADLAVGVPLEDYFAAINEGVAHILYGSRVANGLSSWGNQVLDQGWLGQTAQQNDNLGCALSSR